VKIGIMQPYFFPYIGYYQLISFVDKFVIYDDVNFINRGWINRNNLLINKRALLISIALKDSSQNKLIRDISIADDRNWRAKFLKTIEQAYKKAEHFNETFCILERVINEHVENISQLAYNSLRCVIDYLGLPSEIIRTSAIYNNSNLKAQERILDICKQENADHYINPIGGKEIYSKELFERTGVKLNFIKAKSVVYKQFDNEFIPNLSMIDVLMFNSKDEIKEMLNLYELV
jgi:hypothetical protein